MRRHRGRAFLLIEPIAEQQLEPVTVLMNWPAVLGR